MDAPTSLTAPAIADTDSAPVLPVQAPPSTEEGEEQEQADLLSPKERRYRGLRTKCERLRHFLQHGRCPPGLTRSEMRNLKNQAKVHILDRVSEYYRGLYWEIFVLPHPRIPPLPPTSANTVQIL